MPAEHIKAAAPNGLDDAAIQLLFDAFTAEHKALLGAGLHGWVIFGLENEKPVRLERALSRYDIADKLGREAFGDGRYIVQSLDGEDAPDYAAIVPIE